MSCPILPEPPQPGTLRTCPSCRRRFALKLQKAEKDKNYGQLCTYRCKHCSFEITYADHHPPHAV